MLNKLERNMKAFFQALFFVLISSVVVTDSYAESYQAHGEVYYENGQDKWVRKIVSRDVSRTPIIIKQGGQIISLVFIVEPPPSNRYSLTVSLLTNPMSADDLSIAVLSHTFESTLFGEQNGPFEFEKEQNGIRIGGVIAVSPIR